MFIRKIKNSQQTKYTVKLLGKIKIASKQLIQSKYFFTTAVF